MSNKLSFYEIYSQLNRVIVNAQNTFKTLNVKQQASFAPLMSKINNIDDQSAALKVDFDSLDKQLQSSVNKVHVEALLKKQVELYAELNWLIDQTNEILATLLDASEKSEIVEPKPAEESAEDNNTEDSTEVNSSEESEIVETKKRTRTWLFFAVIASIIVWLIWRNHDFSEAAMVNGQPILIKHVNADSEWAAILAGFAAFASVFFISEVFYSLKNKIFPAEESKRTRSI